MDEPRNIFYAHFSFAFDARLKIFAIVGIADEHEFSKAGGGFGGAFKRQLGVAALDLDGDLVSRARLRAAR